MRESRCAFSTNPLLLTLREGIIVAKTLISRNEVPQSPLIETHTETQIQSVQSASILLTIMRAASYSKFSSAIATHMQAVD